MGVLDRGEALLEADELYSFDGSRALRLVDVDLVPEPDLVFRAVGAVDEDLDDLGRASGSLVTCS